MRRAVRGAGRGGALRARPEGAAGAGGGTRRGGWAREGPQRGRRGRGRGLCRAVMRPRGPGRRPSVRLSGGGLKDMKVSGCGGAGGERPQVGGTGAFGRSRRAGGAGGRVRWDHRFASGRGCEVRPKRPESQGLRKRQVQGAGLGRPAGAGGGAPNGLQVRKRGFR